MDIPAQIVFSPLTPALSPFRGEGGRRRRLQGVAMARTRALAPSPFNPFNGERAGVRGENLVADIETYLPLY